MNVCAAVCDNNDDGDLRSLSLSALAKKWLHNFFGTMPGKAAKATKTHQHRQKKPLQFNSACKLECVPAAQTHEFLAHLLRSLQSSYFMEKEGKKGERGDVKDRVSQFLGKSLLALVTCKWTLCCDTQRRTGPVYLVAF